MKINFHIALIIVALLMTVNIIGALINQCLGYAGQLAHVIDVAPLHVVFRLLFWLSSIPKLKLPIAYRLPLLRVLFWSFIVMQGFLNNTRMASEDLLYHFNQTFCFLFNTLGIVLKKMDSTIINNTYVEVFGINIFGVALYEFAIIKTAFLFYKRRINVVVNMDVIK